MQLSGKAAVVTGASRGIGLAIARRFLAAGARVAICARNRPALEAAARALDGGERLLAVGCDVSRAAEVEELARAVEARLGVPDLVVNNAGIAVRKRLDQLSETEWDSVLDVNLKGAFLVSSAFLGGMRVRGSGRILNLSSISGHVGTAGMVAYCASKHGLRGFTRALAEETREQGIQVNAICPGSVDTDMLVGSGFQPAMTPDAVAGVALYLAAEAPAALTGACIDIFG